MKYLLICVAFFLVLVNLSSAANGLPKAQDLDEKDSGNKKEKDRKDHHRYEDWGQDWSDADMMQHPIDEAPRRENRGLGDICSYSKDCSSGCCLMDRETRQRSCQAMALEGEMCSLGQVKGDLYVDACPCNSGSDACEFPSNGDGRCSF